NKESCEKSSRGLFVCAAVGYYYPKTDTVTWSNAGLPPVIYKCPECEIETWRADAPPLGIKTSSLSYEQQSKQLNNGGLYLLTDGLTDARDENNQRMELSGVIEHIKKIESESPEVRIGKLITATRRNRLNDDATILLIEKRAHLKEDLLLNIQFIAQPCKLKKVRSQVNEIVQSIGFSQ